jgi:hypothetical protein
MSEFRLTHMTGGLDLNARQRAYRLAIVTVYQEFEMPYTKLLSLSMFKDGVQFHLSNRKNPPIFRLSSDVSDTVAAAINAAVGMRP